MQQKSTHCYVRRSLMALLWLLLPCICLHAQKSVQPGRNVTITNGHISLRDVFNVIEKQTGVVLFFGELNTNQLVGVKFVATPIEEALAEMLPPLGLTYEYVKGNKDKIFIRSIVAERKKDTVMVMSVSGVVLDDKGLPLPGASVRLKGTIFGTATKDNGSFTLNLIGEHNIIQVSYTGFVTAEMSLAGRTNVKVQLRPGDNSLNETVVTAYGMTEQRAVTGAITVVKGAEIQNLPNRSFDKSLQGFVPGLLVTSGSGQPGGGLSNFVLRGVSTNADPRNFSIVRNPLIIVDGIPVSQETAQLISNDGSSTSFTAINNPLAQLNPSDIETISVLKDASAIALYGAKSSNGVILITTKKGKVGRTRFNFRHQTDLASPITNRNHMLNQNEYLDLLYEAYRNSPRVIDGVEYPWTEADILEDLKEKFPTHADGSFYPAPDWLKELYRSNAATISNELSLSGGSESSNFYLNAEYTKQNGTVRGTDYDRKSIRLNFESRPVAWLKVGLNTALSYSTQDYGGATAGTTNAFMDILAMSPLNPIRFENGDYYLNYQVGDRYGRAVLNPLASIEYNINRNTAFRGLSKVFAEVNILKGLKFTTNLGVDFMLSEAREKADPRLRDPDLKKVGGRIEEQDTRRSNIISTNIIKYEKLLAKQHSLNIILGQEAQVIEQKVLGVAVSGLSNPYYDQINSPGVSLFSRTGFKVKETLLSYFGQINYDFKSKLFFSGSIRTDGSSRFGADKRFGTYWSAGAGWVISEEPFFKSIVTNLDYLKIRGSVGAAGNAGAINRFTPYDRLQAARYLGSQAVLPTGNQAGNADVKWENTFSWDGGMEIQAFKKRVFLTLDVYRKMTSNLIYSIPIPTNTGYGSILGNIGKLSNKGIELSGSVDVIRKKFLKWNVNANWSMNRNKLVKANSPLLNFQTSIIANKEGESFNSFYLPKWAGVNVADGSSQWVDSTGKPSSDYNAAKPEFVGKSQPDGFGAITNTFGIKGFELSASVYYQYGYQVYDYSSLVHDGSIPYANQSKQALNHWRNPGDNSINPKPLLNNTYYRSTRYLFDASHIRLQNITIAYQFSRNALEAMKLEGLKVYLAGNNLAIWRKKLNEDPSTIDVLGNIDSSYPSQRSFSIGINASF